MGNKKINLALQGGGAHGAFTWGVLDRLLEEDDIEIAAISGTSAGALNGAAVKAGLVEGDRQSARDNLNWLWKQMGAIQDKRMSPWMTAFLPEAGVVPRMIESSPFFAVSDAASRMVSPYGYGPFYNNPLRRIAERFDYDAVGAEIGPAFFVSATNVRTGNIRIFQGSEINADAILASACLPELFRAPEFADPETGTVDAFWDGGYTGNPALFPMLEPELPRDIVVVNINPLERRDVPKTPHDIRKRINEINFNSPLLSELRTIQFIRDLIADGKVRKRNMKDVLIHMIADDEVMNEMSVITRMVPTPSVLDKLRRSGRQAAEQFLGDHKNKIGKTASVDLNAMFG